MGFFSHGKRNRRRTSDGRCHLFRSRWSWRLGNMCWGEKDPRFFCHFGILEPPHGDIYYVPLCTYISIWIAYIYITYLLIWIAHIYIYFYFIYIYIYIYTHVMDVWYRNCTLLLQRFRLPLSKGAEIIEQSTYLPATHLPSSLPAYLSYIPILHGSIHRSIHRYLWKEPRLG